MATMQVLLPGVFLILFTIISTTNSHNVPVFIWGSKSHASLPALSASSHVSSLKFSKEYLKRLINHKTPVVAFIQDRLSLEDMSLHGNGITPQGKNFKHLQTHLDENPSVVLPSVEDPFQVLREIKGHQSIDTLDYNDDVRHALSGSHSDLTLVYLPSTVGIDNRPESLKANDELMSKAVSHFGSKGYIAVFTGKEPSWDAASEEASHRRISRSLLEDAPDNKTLLLISAETEIFVRIVDPLYKYNVTNVTTTWPPKYESKTINETDSSFVSTWGFVNPDGFKSFSMELTFQQKPSSWIVKEMSATFELNAGDSRTLSLKTNHDITAANGFSFSCGKTTFIGKYNYTLYVDFYNFQVEPFSSSNGSFSDSFHCSTFMTLPLWMGFFTILLFTAILGFGIFMLFQVKTMDRFDDPKGKTISVPQSE